MFVRFRQTPTRLQVSLVETRRVDGKVRHEHLASLGSVATPTTVVDRLQFWSHLHDRLGKLSNRVTDIGKVLGDVHARIPMVTPDEQRALQLENAKADAQQWTGIRDLHVDMVEGHKALGLKAGETAARSAERADLAAAEVNAAQARIEAIERGENVDGGLIRKPLTREDFIKAGFTEADLRHSELLHSIPEEHWEEFLEEYHRQNRSADRRFSRRAARAVLQKYS